MKIPHKPRQAPSAFAAPVLLFGALCLALAAVGTLLLVREPGGRSFMETAPALLGIWIVAAPVCLLGNLSLRFLRWRFLLRRAAAPLPERESLRAYFASFAFNFTPLYLGPTLFRVFYLSHRVPGEQIRRKILGVSVAEVFYDAIGLATLGLGAALFLGQWQAAAALFMFLALTATPPARRLLSLLFCLALNWAAGLLGKTGIGLPEGSFRRVFSIRCYAGALTASVAAWVFPCLLLLALLRGAGAAPRPAHVFWSVPDATLAGALSGSPGGALFLEKRLSMNMEPSISGDVSAVVLFYRIGTYWLALAFGLSILATMSGRGSREAAFSHFDSISSVYDAQIPAPIRDRLIERKSCLMIEALRDRVGADAAIGLDSGCGQGRYAMRLAGEGLRVVGLDSASRQLAFARGHDVPAVAGLAERLPFKDQAFDFIYCINILHHLPDLEAQRRASWEIRRALKPGGLFFLHEINTLNPLFRFYMGYVFPILKEIDTGMENWIRPGEWAPLDGWAPERVEYYTFLPDFAPPWMARRLEPLEAWLEGSRWRRYSAHYSALFLKEDPQSEKQTKPT